MGNTKKTLEEMDVMDDFLANAMVADEDVGEDFCRLLLGVLLQRQVGKLRINAQKSFQGILPGKRGIRMDVEIKEDSNDSASGVNLYDLEPHLKNRINIPKHNRFYQAVIDSKQLPSGEEDFDKLPNLFVVTVLNYDLFGEGYMKYCVHNCCEEVPDAPYDDGLTFLYFNTKGTKGGNEVIHSVLNYLQDSRKENVVNEETRKLHAMVEQVKRKPEVRLAYMRFDEVLYWEKKESHEQGHTEGKIEGQEEAYHSMIISFLQAHGAMSEDLREKIEHITDVSLLEKLVKLAAKTDNIGDFENILETQSFDSEGNL